jgi:sortase A
MKEVTNLKNVSPSQGEQKTGRKKERAKSTTGSSPLKLVQTFFRNQTKDLPSILISVGVLFIGLSIVIFVLTFYPVIREEVAYLLRGSNEDVQIVSPNSPEAKENTQDVIVPEDEEFGVIIPKINANAPVVPQVNPFNEEEYQYQLTRGVAHAKGTVLPGQTGNVFLFAHSAGNFYEANRYNAIFYLLNKLEKDNKIVLYYDGEPYTYKVTETKIVNNDQVEYLNTRSAKQTVTLMTCWPAGTTLQRLLVIGERVEE